MAEYREDQHPRGDHGRWSSGGGDVYSHAIASLNDPAFAARHEQRLRLAASNTVGQPSAEEEAYRAQHGHRPLPPDLRAAAEARRAREHADSVQRERAAIENEHAARAAGHLLEVPHAAADAYPAARAAAAQAAGGAQDRLLTAHQAAAQELANVHAADHEERLSATHDLADHFVSTHETLDELTGKSGEREFESAATAEHGDFRAHADRAQSALDTLHAQQLSASADLRAAEKEHGRAATAARKEVESVDPHEDLVSPSARVLGDGDPDRRRAEDAAESLHSYESARRDDMTEGMDFSDAHNALRDETKATERAIRELSRHSGRAPALPGKTKKNRPMDVGTVSLVPVATLRKGEWEEDKHPRDHGKFSHTEGEHGTHDAAGRAHAALADEKFREQHALRLARAEHEARGNFPSDPHGHAANQAVANWQHAEAMRIHAEESAHGNDPEFRHLSERAHQFGDNLSTVDRHERAMADIASAKADREAAPSGGRYGHLRDQYGITDTRAALADREFVSTHNDRLYRAQEAGRAGTPAWLADQANERAGRAVHEEAAKIIRDDDARTRGFASSAHEAEHDQQQRDMDSQSRGFADHQAEQEHLAAEGAKEDRQNEGRAIASGHVRSDAADVMDSLVDQHGGHMDSAQAHANTLGESHKEASAALHALQAYDSSDRYADHADLHEAFNATHDSLREAGLDSSEHDHTDHGSHGYVTGPSHPDDEIEDIPGRVPHPDELGHAEGTPEHASQLVAHDAWHSAAMAEHERATAAHDAEFKRRAEVAQTALEKLHEHQVAAHGDLKRITSESAKSHREAVKTLENMDEGHHVNHEAFAHHERDYGTPDNKPANKEDAHNPEFLVDENARADYENAYRADETMREHAQSRLDEHEHLDFGDSIDNLHDEMKATREAIKALSEHTGRAPRFPQKTKKSANRPDGGLSFCPECGRRTRA